jgi:hypothetical protein
MILIIDEAGVLLTWANLVYLKEELGDMIREAMK